MQMYCAPKPDARNVFSGQQINILTLSKEDEEFIKTSALAAGDGAIVIDVNGDFIANKIFIKDLRYATTSGGARHESASSLAAKAEENGLDVTVIVLSEDSPKTHKMRVFHGSSDTSLSTTVKLFSIYYCRNLVIAREISYFSSLTLFTHPHSSSPPLPELFAPTSLLRGQKMMNHAPFPGGERSRRQDQQNSSC